MFWKASKGRLPGDMPGIRSGVVLLCTVGLVMWRRAEDKRLKGIWWMPWRREAKKDVARCDKPRGGASTH